MEQSDSLLSLSYRLLNVWLEIYCAVGTRSWKELHSSCILLNHLLKGDIRHTEMCSFIFFYIGLHLKVSNLVLMKVNIEFNTFGPAS